MHFVIAGRINCRQYSYAVMVAQRLKENLPDFTYLKIPKKPEEWNKWLVRTCKENSWYHVLSPLIWREIGLKQGKKDFVGDINAFLDLCYDYYGIPREVLSAKSFNRKEMDWFTNRTESEFFENIKLEAKKRREYRSRQVCITGASSQVAEIVVMELLQIPVQRREDGLEIRLFDEPTKEKKLVRTANDAKHCPGPSGLGNCRVANTLKEAFTNADLVIVLDSFGRKPKESLVKWLKRNRNAMCALGKALNMFAPVHCRVIIGSPSTQPICYNATVLASFATRLHVRNIVVVTQDLGREMLTSLSTKINIPLKDFYCPPVWGFVGLNNYIDIRKTLQRHLYKIPGKRIHSTFPQGTEEYELRTSEYLISERDAGDLHVRVSNHKAESYAHLNRWSCLAKATAILDLLKVWGLKQEDGNGEILCLGVYSDGTFNIPKGIYWSQPVILSKGFWVPFAKFPVPRSFYLNYYCLFLYSVAVLYRTKVKPRRYIPPKPPVKTKETKKFDFDKILEEIGMPVIRTDAQCANYLKYLVQKELGIDFDMKNDVLEQEEEEEEPELLPTEEVKREQIYCECWRQELKELQKIIFDRSSTTEVEVDLSDNISGSEWSTLNPSAKISSTDFPLVKNSFGKDNDTKNSSTFTASTTSMVCSCSFRSNGSECHCLDCPTKKFLEDDKISTEHFYKEQNAKIFDEDLKDVIYADTYIGEKHVTFDEDTKSDLKNRCLKFYGREDAVRDKKADLKMKKRILRYERGDERSIDVEEEEQSVRGDKEDSSWMEKTEENFKDAKFHISIPGLSYDIIGDQEGLGFLDERQRTAAEKESFNSFREIYTDEIITAPQVLSSDLEKSTDSNSLKNISISGESGTIIGSIFKDIAEVLREKSTDHIPVDTLEEALHAIWHEGLFGEESEKEQEEETLYEEPQKSVNKKREGIPLCCLCRCIVPEGLPCCPCGTSTVVEVFKKESIEVFIQNEDDLTFRIEYLETALRPESKYLSSLSIEEEVALKVIKKDVPPESFFPFSPKIENKFSAPVRPKEMTKEYIDSMKKKSEKDISKKCAEALNAAKMQLEQTDLEDEDEKESNKTKKSPITSPCEKDNEEIKTDFSDLKNFIPNGIEDWRMTVQRKYREWFYEGPEIRDECYYNIAVEEVSEDEFELDTEIEQYFEK